MRIAVVSSVFIPDLGYLEEGLARVLSGMGHEVHVFASSHYPVNYKGNTKIPFQKNQIVQLVNTKTVYSISRLETLVKFGSNIICRGLKRSLIASQPDLVILVGVSDFFPITLINRSFCSTNRVYAFIGQNYDMGHWKSTNSFWRRILSYIINRVVKAFIFRRSINHLKKLIFYTPDTKEIVEKILPSKQISVLHNKLNVVSLGYNSDDFYFNNESRNIIRSKYKIASDQVVIITVTRVDRSKKILEIIDGLFLSARINAVYIIIGFIENRYKREIEDIIKAYNLEEKIICLPFLSNNLLNDYYSAADFGIWYQSSASIQQAMGAGLPVFLKKNTTTSLLLNERFNGYYIDSNLGKILKPLISEYSFSPEKRKEIEDYNVKRFSYQSILRNLLIE